MNLFGTYTKDDCTGVPARNSYPSFIPLEVNAVAGKLYSIMTDSAIVLNPFFLQFLTRFLGKPLDLPKARTRTKNLFYDSIKT